MELIATILGTVLGGIIGYVSSWLQWKKNIEHDHKAFTLESKRRLVELSYEIIEYVRDYYCNSLHMNLGEFLSCMSGRNPLKSLLAIVVTSVPELVDEANQLMDKIDNMMGSEFPVSEEKYRIAIKAANEFGSKALRHVKSHV